MYFIPERKEMKGGRSGVSLRAANWSEDGGAPRRGPAFISSRRKRSVISNRLASFLNSKKNHGNGDVHEIFLYFSFVYFNIEEKIY